MLVSGLGEMLKTRPSPAPKTSSLPLQTIPQQIQGRNTRPRGQCRSLSSSSCSPWLRLPSPTDATRGTDLTGVSARPPGSSTTALPTRNATIQAKIAPPWRVPWMRTVIPTPEKHARKGRGGSPGMRRESRLKRARGGRMIEGSWRELEEEE